MTLPPDMVGKCQLQSQYQWLDKERHSRKEAAKSITSSDELEELQIEIIELSFDTAVDLTT